MGFHERSYYQTLSFATAINRCARDDLWVQIVQPVENSIEQALPNQLTQRESNECSAATIFAFPLPGFSINQGDAFCLLK